MGISIWQLLVVLLIIVVIFGTKKLRSMGGDMGGAVKGFRDAMKDSDSEEKVDPVKLEEDSADSQATTETKTKDKV